MRTNKILKIGLPALALTILLSAGSVYASTENFTEKSTSLTPQQKEVLAEAKSLRDEGKVEEAQELLKESGIKFRGHGKRHQENRPDIKEAIENQDYEQFLELTKNSPRHQKITEEQFNKMVEIHKIFESGDKEAAKEMMKELGFKKGPRGPKEDK